MDAIPLSLVSRRYGPVLTYHATFPVPPPDIAGGVDNVRPAILYEQLSQLKMHFTVVSIDEYCAAKSVRGLAAVTFDDGYKSVLADCLGVFESLDIPVTLFVNTAALDSEVFWRDRIRFLMSQGMAEEFAAYSRVVQGAGRDLFMATKNPRIDSRLVVRELQSFFADRALLNRFPNHIMDSSEYRRHPLVSYGNHTHHHYVLSSLPRDAQREEMLRTHDFLRSVEGIQVSRVFCAPFGGSPHVNRDTFQIARDLGYTGVVMNRGRLNSTPRYAASGVRIIERVMPTEHRLDQVLCKQYLKSLMLPAFQLPR